MRLKRLELFGFKSFADRTVLDFEKSLMGIVGPNGCGKSNVVDAMRWVLGETRPTSMRGGEMTDVIFKGSASRPALGVAEATMVLDNAQGTIEERGPEISVTRRVFRSGEGEYLVDGDRVRLKDIREMLFDTGLGSRGYSVLEQGRIDAVLSANPLERRAIFEEAAGISRYRQRKKEAESRLKRVAQDVERLDDLVGELQTRSRSLKIQAGKAERFLASREAWREAGERLARHRLDRLDIALDGHRSEVASFEARAEELRGLREAADGDVRSHEAEQEALAAELDRLSGEAASLGAELGSLDERRAQVSARIHGWNETSSVESSRAEELELRLRERREEIEAQSRNLERLEGETAAGRTELQAAVEEAASVRERYHTTRRENEAQNERVLGLLHEKTAAANSVSHLEQSLEPLARRAERATQRLAEARAALATAEETQQAAGTTRDSAADHVRELEQRARTIEAEWNGLSERSRAAAVDVHALELERERCDSRIEALEDREAEREGLSGGARELLEALDGGDAPALAEELRGFVADHLAVPSAVARALDAALGDRAQALVVASDADAESILTWLAEGERGQARLALPTLLSGVSPERDVRRELPATFAADADCLGRLVDQVQAAPGYEALADAWLADVVLVRDAASARRLRALDPGFRFATPAGDLFETGAVLGGHRTLAQGPIGRRSQAADLRDERAVLEERWTTRRAEAQQLESARDRAATQLEAVREEAADGQRALERARAELESSAARTVDLTESVGGLEHEAHAIDEERRTIEVEVQDARERQLEAEGRFEAENKRLEQLDAERTELDNAREVGAREEGRLRVEVTRLEEQLESERRRHKDLEAMCADAGGERERALTSAELNRRQAEEGAAELERLSESRVQFLEKRGAVESRLTELREHERGGREQIDELRRRAQAVTHELERLGEALSAERLDVQRVELELDELLRRAAEDHGLDRPALKLDFEPDPELADEAAFEELASEVGSLKAQLDKLGPVNVEAVEELDAVTERLDFLVAQRTDLAQSRAALENTLRQINSESERRFLEAFEEIRGNFQRIFRQLFGGGRADVELLDDAPALEAGIEISARPPGREMLPIGLLSGGQRTLTALALLFSVFQARPSPFCVLDEVDAALDDANIARFLGMLENFRSTTQFVVVTHNKGTMAACDLLYGVTMETKGVSRQVSVELDDVDEFVPEVRGSAAPEEGAKPGNGATAKSSGGGSEEAPREAPREDGLEVRDRDADTGEPIRDVPRPESATADAEVAQAEAASATAAT